MTKNEKRAMLEARIKTIEGRGKSKGEHGIVNKLKRRLIKENF